MAKRFQSEKDLVYIKIKDKETGLMSKEVPITEVIFNQREIEFEFPEDEFGVECVCPYKDFLFFVDDYELTIVMKDEKQWVIRKQY